MAALGVLLAAIVAQLPRSARPAFAQDPTFTPTWTLWWTPTFTPTWTPFFPFGSPTPTWTPFFPFGSPTPTWTPFIFGTPTPAATPTPRRRVITEISSPKPGDAAAGFAAIEGTALKTSFRRYEISISPAGAENWSWLMESLDVIYDDVLYYLDTTRFPDGYYDIRLRAIDDIGNYVDAFLRGLEIRNAYPPTPTPRFNPEGTLIPPAPVSPLGPPTPTPRPRILANDAETGQGIFAPEIGEKVFGLVDVIATVNGGRANPFSRYEVAISAAGMDNWNWLYSSEQQVWRDVVYTLDTRRFPDGLYDLRVRIVFRDSNYDDFTVRYMQIANESHPDAALHFPNGIFKPESWAAVQGVVNFVGTASDPNFMRWELAWSPAGAEAWAFLVSSDRQAMNSTLARLDLSKLGGSLVDFRLRVVRQDYNYDEYFVREVKVKPPPATPTPPYSPIGTPTPTPMG